MGLSRAQRIRKGSHFRRVLREGSRLEGRLFVLAVRWNEDAHARLGVSVGRRVGGAVERNRIKRLLREAFRSGVSCGRPVDAVVLTKPEIRGCALRDISDELRRRIETWARRQEKAHGRSPVGPRAH